jgi:DNA-binding GntR family transcriptional regulator
MKSVTDKSKYRYQQIAEMIQSDISTRYKHGEMIASEQLLAKKYAVSCVTLRQALGHLAQRGFVRRHHGRGTVVVDRTSTGELAILVRPGLLEVNASPYYYLVRSYLFEYLRKKKVSLNIKIHAG